MKRLRVHWAWLLVLCTCAGAQERVTVPSLDAPHGAAIELPGFWFAAPAGGERKPAWVLLHGCSGPYGRSGALSSRMREYAALVNAEGMHALVIDSLSPRGERQLCTQRIGRRKVTQTQRRRDALGALAWLAARRDVDPSRIGLLGWSNGGSTVLATTNLAHPEVAAAPLRAASAVAFYPGCEAELARGYRPAAPLLMLLGESDDWTPAAPCHALAAEAPPPRPVVRGYPGAFHGFDGDAPLRLRSDVPGGVHPGEGVHVGADPAAREAARAELQRWLRAMVPMARPPRG